MSGTVCIIQARLGSSRYPGKVLEDIGGYPALFHVVMRARHALPRACIVIAAPAKDVPQLKANCVGDYFGWDGEESDVLGRFYACAQQYGPQVDTVVRLTADCPFVCTSGISHVEALVDARAAPYAWTGDQVNGLDAEAFTVPLLRMAHEQATDAHDREHVTPWMKRNVTPARYAGFDNLPRYRWTLDTADDLEWCRAIASEIEGTPPDPDVAQLVDLLERRPDLRRMEA